MKLKILLHLVIELSHLQTWVYMPPIWKGDKNTPSAFYCWGVKTIRFSVCFAFKAMSLWNTVSMTVFRTVCSGNLQGRCIMNATRTVTSYVPLQRPEETEEERAELWWVPVGSHGIIKLQDFFLGTNDTNSLHSLSQQNPIVGFAFMTLFVPLCRRCKVQVVRKKFPHSYQKISSESHNRGNLSGTHRIILNQIWSSYYYWQICETLWLHVIQKGSDHIHWHQIW